MNHLTRAILAVKIALANDAAPEAIARAVMEAMMEPSEEMVTAAKWALFRWREASGDPQAEALPDEKHLIRWQAMLRAAMDENVEG